MLSTDVALILCNPDVIDLVEYLLRQRNVTYVGLDPWEGIASIQKLITNHRPQCIVMDLVPNYGPAGQCAVRLMKLFRGSKFIFTAADPKLAVKTNPWLNGFAVFQKPFDPTVMADLIFSMSRRSMAAASTT